MKKEHTPRKPRPYSIANDDKKEWKEQEERLAERSGGFVQPASGALPTAKGDVKDGHGVLLIEAKSTDKKSLSIKRDWIIKIWHEAKKVQKTPCLSICFNSINKKQIDPDWACVPFGWLMTLLDELDACRPIEKRTT